MNNIFENAYFGKAYKTRAGKKAIYIKEKLVHESLSRTDVLYAQLVLETGDIVEVVKEVGVSNGTQLIYDNLDIVSEWQEELTDDELAKLINETIKEKDKLSKHYEGLGLYYGYSYVDILKEVLHKLLKNK